MRNVVTVPADKLRAMQERIAELEASVEEHRNIAVSEMKLNEKLKAENDQAIELLIGWLKSDDDLDITIHTDRWLRNKCNCENELPPCKICYELGGE